MNERVVMKLSSGKFLFTMVAAVVFLYCAVTGKLPPDKIYDVISIVLIAYFVKGQNGGQAK